MRLSGTRRHCGVRGAKAAKASERAVCVIVYRMGTTSRQGRKDDAMTLLFIVLALVAYVALVVLLGRIVALDKLGDRRGRIPGRRHPIKRSPYAHRGERGYD